MTFKAVGERVGLTGRQLNRFVTYMTARWWGKEQDMCQFGYADEWANRFLKGVEYEASDVVGKARLNLMDKEEQNG